MGWRRAVVHRLGLRLHSPWVNEPGPAFAFSRAEIAPLAPGTDLPVAFKIGKPAETGVIRDAAKAGVDGWRSWRLG